MPHGSPQADSIVATIASVILRKSQRRHNLRQRFARELTVTTQPVRSSGPCGGTAGAYYISPLLSHTIKGAICTTSEPAKQPPFVDMIIAAFSVGS